VDDHSVVTAGIENLLSGEKDFDIVGSAGDGRRALSMVKSLNPDIVILDISMPHKDGVELAHEINNLNKNIGILIYSMSISKAHITALFKEGVSGYVLKHEPLSELILALKVIREGATFYSKSVQEILQDHVKELELGKGKDVAEVQDGIAKLSVREKEVFVLLADGLTPKEISKRLGISHKTVETHKYNIMDKLNISTIAQFTKIAIHKDLIKI
jgi:RNA polymerase sigma factor (sigma-70 family)